MKTPRLPANCPVSRAVRTVASQKRNTKVRPCLWFEKGGEEAARFYVTLGGAPYQILNGGPEVSQSPAVSISVVTEDQAETDRLWEAMTEGGGEEGRCSWLTDRFGVSWQIVPRALIDSLTSDDRAGSERAFQAMLGMSKIDVTGIEAAFRGD